MVLLILNLLELVHVLCVNRCDDSFLMVGSHCVDQSVIIGATVGVVVPVLVVLIAVISILVVMRWNGNEKYKYKYKYR